MSDPAADAAYQVQHTVSEAEFARMLRAYRERSDEAVEGLAGHPGIAYDEPSGELLDVWGPGRDGERRPVFLVVHGGYWRRLSRLDTAFMARALDAEGIATVSVDYSLAPDAPLEEMVRQVRAAVAWVYRRGVAHGLAPERITVGGSSAGGHLAGALMVPGWQEAAGLPVDVVKAALPISGLFDLRPLVDAFCNEWLGLDGERAAALSPLLAVGPGGPPAVVAVAERDGSGFLEQSRAFRAAWAEHAAAELLVVPDRHHYDVFLDLADPKSELFGRLVELVRDTGRAR
ncbi:MULTISPECIES: alpha/beta hydrolase [unclassified Streptomyces]|uniref:alpha/beta hydrolase n=1 Tax=unclassified Streptomyces TaxID=2593676 RepID=UPI00278C89D7|nr:MULTISPECIES: alpha/beta hydrolase [unclassified Streptomyces]